MTRIFTPFAVLNTVALLATFLMGVVSRLRDGVLHPEEPTYLIHFVLGLFTAVGTLLVHCLIFTYFLGTGRWVKEVSLAYGLPDEPWHKETRELKRKVFPPALYAMLITIAASAAGAGAQLQEWPWTVHATLATVALLVNLWAFRAEYRYLTANVVVLDGVLAAVDQVRAARGLPSNAEALRAEEEAGRS